MDAFSFGVFADVQYARRRPQNHRYYQAALGKLKQYMQCFQKEQVSFLVHLGDLIDEPEDEERALCYAREATQVIQAAGLPCCYVIGNHDTGSVALPRLAPLWGWQAGRAFGSFDVGALHFVVLDTNYDAKGQHYTPATHQWEQSYVSEEQLSWLQADLARTDKPRVMVFAHALLDALDNPHAVRNGWRVRSVLESCGRKVTVLQGHMHCGYESEQNGIRYYTLPATVEGESEFCYWIVTVEKSGQIVAKIVTHEGARTREVGA